MEILFLGHAGLYVETRRGSVLCDPWFNPAYFGSWWPFPANDHLDPHGFSHPTYLYISHLHQDHFDPQFLGQWVDRHTTVLLPDYPLPTLKEALANLGFYRQVTLPAGRVIELDGGLMAAIWPLVAPGDGPLGDSYLWLDDGDTRILNLNDAHPRELEPVRQLGRLDGLFLQFSGAIWYPVVYEFPAATKARLGAQKRLAEMRRASLFIRELNPRAIFPVAGPPAFLDDDLFSLNDLDRDESNIFPDQTVFLEHLALSGLSGGSLVVPGSHISLGADGARVAHRHLEPGQTLETIFSDKATYLRRYQARMRPQLEAERRSWPPVPADLVLALKRRLSPILHVADLTSEQIRGDVVLDFGGGDGVRINFHTRRVLDWDGEPAAYGFRVDPRLVAALLRDHQDDWVNSLFLSLRFKAWRQGEYNEAVYTFFKCLSPERIQFAEGYWMEQNHDEELWECAGFLVQRRCPHLKADLRRFASVDDRQILTCHMHGWQFDLKTGACLNAHNRHLYRRPLEPADASSPEETNGG